MRIFGFGDFGAGGGDDVAVFLVIDGFAGEAANGVNQGDIGVGVLLEQSFAFAQKGFEELGGGDMESGELDVSLFEIGNGFDGHIELGDGIFEPDLVFEPILESGGVPAGDIHFLQALAVGPEGGDDFFIAEAVIEELVQFFADLAGEAADFAARAPAGFVIVREGLREGIGDGAQDHAFVWGLGGVEGWGRGILRRHRNSFRLNGSNLELGLAPSA